MHDKKPKPGFRVVVSSPAAIERDGSVIISFRGTDSSSLSSMASNMDLSEHDALLNTFARGYVEVHKGYQSYALRAFDALLQYLSENKLRINHIYITGHSLGGATATVFAALLHQRLPNLNFPGITVTTFGAPMSGNAKFSQWYNKVNLGMRTIRAVHDQDRIGPPFPLNMDESVSRRYLQIYGYNKWEHVDGLIVATSQQSGFRAPHGMETYMKLFAPSSPWNALKF